MRVLLLSAMPSRPAVDEVVSRFLAWLEAQSPPETNESRSVAT